MELSRRDALVALAAVGGVAGGAALTWDRLGDAHGFTSVERDRLVALAEVLYPSDVEGVQAFVERYTVGRVLDRPAYAAGMREALAELDERARDVRGTPWLELSSEARDEVLRELGVGRVDPDPAGIGLERIRFYLVNELLYALYTTPTGGTLVGIENPIGYPGGITSYRRPPSDDPATVGRRTRPINGGDPDG